jgi:hypothetical protein
LLKPELFDQASCRHLTIPERFYNRDSGGVGQRLKNFGFELPERIGHKDLVYSNF